MVDTTASSHMEEHDLPPALPQVLTHNVIPMLTRNLDASDVLECYALTRSAPLHGIANSTIHIQKTAVGIRYRPTGAAVMAAQQQHIEKLGIELTLEYGPQRFGPLLHHEAMPYIQVSEEESSFIGWENVGRVFYTTKIESEIFLSSYYMGSMTGTVLNKMLVDAVDYSEKRRRYQPFAVFSAENGREVRSSSSVDFAQYVWRRLANLGVEIAPILPPPIYEARLWVSSWEKVVPQPSMADEAAAFYQNLYQCLEAIATNEYTAYQPTAQPTISPMPTLTPTITSAPTDESGVSEIDDDEGESDSATSLPPGDIDDDLETNKSSSSPMKPLKTEAPTSPFTDDQEHDETDADDETGDAGRRSFRWRKLEDPDGVTEDFDDEDIDEDDFVGNDDDIEGLLEGDNGHGDEDDLSDNDDNNLSTEEPSATGRTSNPTITPSPSTLAPTPSVPQTGQVEVEKVQQAAADAQEAANEAKNAAHTEGETKAADAAQAAAHAAQMAADATSNAAAMTAMDGLLSGDGTTMTSIVTTCFTNPQYDIASVDENGTVTISAFLYRDGSNYYKLNLTSPYLEIAKVNRALPKAKTMSNYGNNGDLIDFVLAAVVLISIFLLVVILLQQMGYEFFQSLSRCQRWFFNPRKYDYEGDTLDEEENDFNFGEDGIPLSMGGRLSKYSPLAKRPAREHVNATPPAPELRLPKLSHGNTGHSKGSASGGRLEVEMSTLPSSRMRPVLSDNESSGSLSGDELEVDSAIIPRRLMRDPELVDMPYLKSTSKVAVPVGSSGSGSAQKSYSEMDTSAVEFHFS